MEILRSLLTDLAAPRWLQVVFVALLVLRLLFGAFFKLWRDVGDHQHSVQIKRRIERVTQLADAAPKGTELASAVQRLTEAEIFAIAFKVQASPARAAALSRMFNTGLFSPATVRILARFVRPSPDDRIRLVIEKSDYLAAAVSAFVILFSSLYVALMMFQLLSSGVAGAWLGVVVIGLFWVGVLLLFGRDIRAIYLAEDAQKHLTAFGLLASAE